MATFLSGSTHVLSINNLKDVNGVSEPLPPNMPPPKLAANPAAAVAFGVQNPDGSQPVTFDKTFQGNVTFSGTWAYPNGNAIALTPVTCAVAFPENKTGDIVIT